MNFRRAFIDQARLSAGGCDSFGISSLFEIVCSERCTGAALPQLLKLRDDFLSFFSLTATHERRSEIVECGRVVRFGGNGCAKNRYCFRILSLLCEQLAKVYIHADIVWIDAQHFSK